MEFDHVQLQMAQLSILKEIDKVCQKKGLSYYLAYGTAIGAVRHKGFIPWDDDIDIYMTLNDLNKLEHCQSLFPSNLFIQTRKTDPEYGLMITRIRDSNTTLIENEEYDRDINHGVFVDIYPLYNSPVDSKELKRLYLRSLIGRLFLYGKPPKNHGKFLRFVGKTLLTIMPNLVKRRVVNSTFKLLKKQKDTGYLTPLSKDDGKSIPVYPKEYFDSMVWVDFEDMKAPIPSGNHEVLKAVYGDYMKLPPMKKRVIHHDYRVVDCNNSYIKYKGIDYCIKD